MLLYITSLFLMGSGLWCTGRFGDQIRSGRVVRFFAPMRGSVDFSSRPIAFVLHGASWMAASLALLALGTVFLLDLDPTLLVLPPSAFVATRGIALALRQAGAVSGDGGDGSVEALAGHDRAALATRVEALPDGAERRMLERALAAWPIRVDEPGYRHRGDPERRVRFEALRLAAHRERRRFGLAMALGAVGFVPLPATAYLADRIVVRELAILGVAIGATLALGALVIAVLARRRVDALVARIGTLAGGR